MARRAVVGKHGLAACTSQRQQGRILLDVGERRAAENRHLLAAQFLQIGKVGRDTRARRILEQPRGVARDQRPGRVDDPVADRPDDRRIECQDPPPRQRRIELLDAIPFMTGGAAAGNAVNLVVLAHDRSVLTQRHAGCGVELGLVAGPKRVGDDGDEDSNED
ncbi:hypothetical protein chiPu_0033754, partial [Chiloscyllium punctatum]|nr:hypothetical protein [Chiloscyllium punctatum]